MSAVRSHRDLIVWQRGMELAEHCYRLTAGHNHGSTAVFIRHVAIALGSQAEAETQLELAWRLGFVTAESR